MIAAALKSGSVHSEVPSNSPMLRQSSPISAGRSSSGGVRPSAVPVLRECECAPGSPCQCTEENRSQGDEAVARQTTAGGSPAVGRLSPSRSFVQMTLQTAGRPLENGLREKTEASFGADFSGVRIHTGSTAGALARSIDAVAYTVGSHVVFGEGGYAPETPRGWRTLVHELTHVVQQSGRLPSDVGSGEAEVALSEPGDPLEREAERVASGLERPPANSGRDALSPSQARPQLRAVQPLRIHRLECNLDPVKDECAGAGAKCAGVKDYCTAHYPNPGDIDTLHANAVQGAKGQAAKLPKASANLLHFLDASGTEMVMGTDIFKNHSATIEKLDGEHLDKFKAGAQRRLNDGTLKVGGPPVDMIWTGTANAFNLLSRDDLGLAVGGYTLCSKVTATASPTASGATAQVSVKLDPWTVQAFDCYNWDPGKGIGLPGADDNDLCCLENAGKAKHFLVRTDPWQHKPETFVISASPAPPSANPSTPSQPPPTSQGDRR